MTSLALLYDAYDSDPSPVVAFLRDVVESRIRSARARVLDVGCGTGRLFAPFRTLGWEVVGLEPDPEYRARATAVGAPLGVSVRDGTFNSVSATAEFDLIVGINSSFAHVLTPLARLDALERCRRALRSPGVLVLDVPNTLKILFEYRRPAPLETIIDGQRISLTRDHVIDYATATFTTRETYTVVPASGMATAIQKEHPYAITTWPELAYLLDRAGFGSQEVYDGFDSRVPGHGDGRRLLIVAPAT